MKLTLFYGERVNSYYCSQKEGDEEEKEWAPSNHQICFSNEFAPGWKNINNGTGGWYIGCIWIRGLGELTRKQLQDILKKVPETFGDQAYGTTLDNTIQNIEKKMNRLVTYIVSNSPVGLTNVKWEWGDLKKFKKRVQTMLSSESNHMCPSLPS